MPDQGTVLDVFHDGVEAFAGSTLGPDDPVWHTQVCGIWTGADLAGHVLAVSRWYHEWLDRAEAGESDPPFPAGQMAARNQSALSTVAGLSVPERLAAFRREANAYAGRVAGSWDLPYGFPYGRLTAGRHAALGALEWHTHAWDLARGAGGDHRPVDPDALLEAVLDAWSHRQGRMRGAVVRRFAPVGRRAARDPWAALLKNTGRRA